MNVELQESVVIVIKYSDKVLLRYRPTYKDLCLPIQIITNQEEAQFPIRSAYRFLYKDLSLIGGLDFELVPIEPITPLEFQTPDKSGQKILHYKYYTFFSYIKDSSEGLLNSPNDRWIKISSLKLGYKDSLSIPLSKIVPYILPKLSLEHRDSFDYKKEFAIKDYRQEILQCIDDPISPGYIDEVERKILDRKKIQLGLSDFEAKKVEHEILANIKSAELIEMENISSLENLITFPNLINDLQYYARIKKFKKLKIKNIFNEGKTGALVFQVQGNKENETVSKILKYDFYLRVQKEYNNFMENERLHGVFASPKWEQFILEQNAFLELQPADEFANAKEMSSLRQIINHKLKSLSEDVSTKTSFIDALREILDWIFRKVYRTEVNDFDIRTQKFQNSFDHFLPPRWILQGKIYPKDSTSLSGMMRVPTNNIISYDIKRKAISNTIQLIAKVWFTQKDSTLMYRCDVICDLNEEELEYVSQNRWELYVAKGEGDYYRKDFLVKLKKNTEWLWEKASKFQLSPILREVTANNKFEIGFYIDLLLQKTGKVYSTKFLHGDFNPSNLLFCRSDSQKFYPILIDFYDAGVDGSVFYDFARLEIEIIVVLLTNYINKILGTPINCETLSDPEIDLILDWEENTFNLSSISLFTGDFILLEVRKILYELAAKYFSEQFSTFDWLKNYCMALGIFGIGFQKFKNESNLSRYIALIWASRALYRFDHFNEYIAAGTFNKVKKEDFLNEELVNPVQKLKNKCSKANSLYEIEYGSLQIAYDLFVDYNLKLKENLSSFLKHKDSNAFAIVDESGTGKTWFVNYFFTAEAIGYPFLFIPGNANLKDENGFLNLIQSQLKLGTDWTQVIEEVDLKGTNFYFCIIIENIADNPDSELAKDAIKTLLKHIAGTKTKLVLLIESWFWNDYFDKDELIKKVCYRVHDPSNKAKFSFYSEMDKPTGVHQDLLIQNYFKHYNIIGELTGQALSITNRPGFLKQFCEVTAGKKIGKLDYISTFEILFSYTNLKHIELATELGIPVELIEEIILNITKKMYDTSSPALKIINVLEEFPKIIHGVKEHFLVQFIKAAMQIKYFPRHTTKISYSFGDIQPFLESKRIVKGWLKSPENEINSKIENWIQERMNDLLSPSMEDMTSYIARHLYLSEDKQFFIFYVSKITTNFKSYTIPVLRFLSKTIPVLPHIPPKILKLLYDIDQDIKVIQQGVISTELKKEIQSYYFRLDNIEYGREAQQWSSVFESMSQLEICDYIVRMGMDYVEQLSYFVVNKDSKKGEHFLRNYLRPLVPILQQNINRYIHSTKPIIELCNTFLSIYRNSKDTSFVLSVFELIHTIACIEKEALLEGYDILLNAKIENMELLPVLNTSITKWIQLYYKDKFITDTIYDRFFDYAATYYGNIRRELDYECYQIVLGLIQNLNIFSKTSILPETKKKIYNYAKENLPASITLFEKLSKEISEMKIEWQEDIKQLSKIKEHQRVAEIIIKYQNKLLLQYNPKWQDYNWISAKLEEKLNQAQCKEKVIQSLSEKLNLKHEEDFWLRDGAILIPEFENYSPSRGKIAVYSATLYVAQFKDSYTIESILKNPENKFFSLEDIVTTTKYKISMPVKRALSYLKKDWDVLPDALY